MRRKYTQTQTMQIHANLLTFFVIGPVYQDCGFLAEFSLLVYVTGAMHHITIEPELICLLSICIFQ